MVGRPKPAPDVYLLAAQRMGRKPAECVVIEDSPAAAAGALGAGFRVTLYAPGPVPASQPSGVRVMRSMDELAAHVAALC
jgi:beta-phosphoglucomutase-like phosphatase (HAD superfamily)